MKKILSLLLTTFIFIGFTACSNEEKSISVSLTDVTKKLQQEISFPEMGYQPSEVLQQYYNIDINDFDEFEFLIAGNGVTADEILMVKLKNASSDDLLAEEAKNRQSYLQSEFEQYNPAEIQKINDAVIFQKSNYFVFVISDDSKKVNEILNQEFK